MTNAILSLPPGPRAPAGWNLLRYSLRPLEFLEECGRRHGEAFSLGMTGYGKFVFLSSPEAVKDVFRGDAKALHSGEGNEFLSINLGKNSVLVLDEEPHAEQRRALLPPLKGERMRAFFDAMQAAALDLSAAAVQSAPPAAARRIDTLMRDITSRVILQATLGIPPGAELSQLENLVRDMFRPTRSQLTFIWMTILPLTMMRHSRYLPFFRELTELDKRLYAMMAAARAGSAGGGRESVIGDLLATAHESGQPLSDEEIRDAVVTILFAGHETTAVALAWALEQIVPRADVVAEIEHELKEVAGGELPQAEQIPQLEYLDAAIRESLRVRTILPIVVRKTKQPFEAGGRTYPPGIVLCPSSHLVHRRSDLYPEPEKFRPERFLERKFAPHEWFPFGGGNRTCLGMAFALYEMKVVLSTLFSRFAITRPDGKHSRYVRQGLVLGPRDGVPLVMTRK